VSAGAAASVRRLGGDRAPQVPSTQAARIVLGARLLALVAIGAPVLWYRESSALLALVAVSLVWALCTLAERSAELVRVAALLDAAAVGLASGQIVQDSQAILLVLALPAFAAAVLGGARRSLVALLVELVAFVLSVLVAYQGFTADQTLATFTAGMAALGLGLIGTFVHAALAPTDADHAPYLDAQRLIRQLLDLSDDLSSGLDVTTLAGEVMAAVGDALPTAGLAVYVPRGEVLVPLVSRTPDGPGGRTDLLDVEMLAAEAWARAEPLTEHRAFAFPVGQSAVVGGVLSASAGLGADEVARTTARLRTELRTKAVQLDTAVLFADFRDTASADVRRRLAREMHDGVAQDIASLGYVVDARAARPASEQQREQLEMLRERISRIVAEVRQSVLTLRTSIGESESLGAAIGAVARHLSEASQIPIQVRLDEHATRLRPDVESELFRIAQEAMNNAIKHAECTSIEVTCTVYAPDALITVVDDGRGLQQARSDSHGMKIMRERARLVGGRLTVEDRPDGGLAVAVQIGDPRRGTA
jgi:signal transduction histidine kinase